MYNYEIVSNDVRSAVLATVADILLFPDNEFSWDKIVKISIDGNTTYWSEKLNIIVEILNRKFPHLEKKQSDAVKTYGHPFEKIVSIYTRRIIKTTPKCNDNEKVTVDMRPG